jgi:hypothetical protein
VYSEREKGRQKFAAYPTERKNLPIRNRSESPDMD